jgi:putative DNA primase/helicase
MQQVGIEVPATLDLSKAFAKLQRFRPVNEKKVKKSAWVRLHEFRAKSGKVYISGAFGWRGEQWKVEASSREWSTEERQEWIDQQKAAAKAAEAERQAESDKAAEKARKLWSTAREEGASAYLDRKKVRAFGIRFGFNSRLMVPLRDLAGELQGVQWISPDGDKIFGTGTRKEGRFHRIGEIDPAKPLAFAEGYATGASVHMATGWPVVVCFDAGNLEPVVSQWRKLYPELEFVIAADDDRHLLVRLCERLQKFGVHATPAELGKLDREHEWTVPAGPEGGADLVVELKAGWSKDGAGVPCITGTITVHGEDEPAPVEATPHIRLAAVDGKRTGGRVHKVSLENAGRSRAVATARRVKARVLLPAFDDAASAGTDWNDLHVAQGLEAVATQLRAGLEGEDPAKNRADDRPHGGAGKGRDKLPPQDTNEPKFVDALGRWTLLYGTTTVWDEDVRQVLRIESLKLAYGRLVDWWLAHDMRHMIPADRLVFDPTGKCQRPQYVNLFKGLPLEPNPNASCKLIKAHLFNLCQEDERLFHWVCCWLALPLQQLGTKMHTALVLHGRTEGTGKTLFTTIMRRIYGVHSRTINQRQLETEFNGWISGMMFVVAEEVVSRADRQHLQGVLQDMITGETVNINEKNMPLRTEANFTNFVFQSNQQVPVLLNRSDRRHTVIRIEREHPEGYFDAILEEMADGGVEAFYHWLLHYDVGDFTKRSKPFLNRDRMHLITLGMSPDQRFFQYWESGVAGLPFVTCPATDLYTGFKAWCKVNGERFVPNQTQFGRTVSEELERLRAPEKKLVRYWAYSDKVVIDGDWSEDAVQLRGVVYFVHAAIERRGSDGQDAADQPDGADPPTVEDVTEPKARDARIKLFQAALHALIGSARRSL